jgi:hypothetical protein
MALSSRSGEEPRVFPPRESHHLVSTSRLTSDAWAEMRARSRSCAKISFRGRAQRRSKSLHQVDARDERNLRRMSPNSRPVEEKIEFLALIYRLIRGAAAIHPVLVGRARCLHLDFQRHFSRNCRLQFFLCSRALRREESETFPSDVLCAGLWQTDDPKEPEPKPEESVGGRNANISSQGDISAPVLEP